MDNQDNSDSISIRARIDSPVTEKESGQKLLRFLERRLKLPGSLLHRWIRTGQIRINGARCKPFDRVQMGDMVRLPPFARAMAEDMYEDGSREDNGVEKADSYLEILEVWKDIIVINKPAGLPVQMGTGHEDSVNIRLEKNYGSEFFKPAAAHRLDRDTSGLLLAGATFDAQKTLQEEFKKGNIHKEYLAWVKGRWNKNGTLLLRHFLRKEKMDGKTRMHVLPTLAPFAREALSLVRPLRIEDCGSLLQIRILTGVTHQIRAQLAACGFPVIGDGKYGKSGEQQGLCLHACRIILPEGREFCLKPAWGKHFSIDDLPSPILAGISKIEAILAQPELMRA